MVILIDEKTQPTIKCINPPGAKTGLFRDNSDNAMAADALFPCQVFGNNGLGYAEQT